MKKSLRVSILSHKEEQFLKKQLVGLKTQQLKALSENKILNEFLLTVSIEKEVVAYSSNGNEIIWDASSGFNLNLQDNFYDNFEEVCSALKACREVFFEDYLSEEDLTDLKGLSLVSEFNDDSKVNDSPSVQKQEPETIIDETPTDLIEHETDTALESSPQEDEDLSDTIDEPSDVDSALELADQLISDAQDEDSSQDDPTDEIPSDESIEDALKLADEMISEVESIESAEESEAPEALETLTLDVEDEELSLPEPVTQEEAPQEEEPPEDEIDVNSLLDRVGELDKTTLSGSSEDIAADEFANLTPSDDHELHEVPAEADEEEEVDLLSRIGEIDSNTLADSHDDIPADEFTNLAAVEETLPEVADEPQQDPVPIEPAAEEVAPPVEETPVVEKELSPQEIAEKAQRDLEAITEEMYAIGMDDDKIETLINAVQDGKATIDLVRQTIDKVKSS
ncbi:MAG: hypothetical protein KC646_02015 [Candidatus Cloacimonetes bacterium]|nr:hypothetical protein [Candidatus Cloacimonadota bacterium]